MSTSPEKGVVIDQATPINDSAVNTQNEKHEQPQHADDSAASTSPDASGNDSANGDNNANNDNKLERTVTLPEDERTKLETTLIMGALCVSLFLAALDMSIITTAVPTIVAHFNSPTGYVWVGSAYLLGNAAFVPTWGKVSDIFGRKSTLLVAVSIFLIGSLLCGVSQSMGMLIGARAIQGIGGGGAILMPNICVADLFSMRNRGMYFGMLGMVWAIASAIGPVIGGLFTSKVSWRWCFYINLPTGGVAMAILIFFLKLHNPRTPLKEGLAAIDWIGNLLVIGGTLMVLIGLEFGGVQFAWDSATVICLIVFGFVTLAIFCVWVARIAKYPVIPLRVFQNRNSVIAYLTAVCHAMSFMGSNYYLPLYFQSVVGADSLMSGVYLLPYVVSMSLVSAVSGLVIKRTGNFRWPIVGGFLIMTLGLGLYADLGAETHWERIVLFQIVAGLGVGPNFQAPLIAIQTNIEPRDIGSATSCFSFFRQIGTSIAVTIGGVVFNNIMNNQRGELTQALGPELGQEFSNNAAASIQKIDSLPADKIQLVKSAYWNALQKMFILFACVCALGLIISFFVKQTTLSKDHKEHKTGLQSLKQEQRNKNASPDEETPAETLVVSNVTESK